LSSLSFSQHIFNTHIRLIQRLSGQHNREVELRIQEECPLLSAFAKLRKVTIRCVMAVCLCVCQAVRMEQLGSQRMNFHENWHENIFRKYFQIVQV